VNGHWSETTFFSGHSINPATYFVKRLNHTLFTANPVFEKSISFFYRFSQRTSILKIQTIRHQHKALNLFIYLGYAGT